ncbi:hypothetical protein V2J09_006343 [Rumex salicifolius]
MVRRAYKETRKAHPTVKNRGKGWWQLNWLFRSTQYPLEVEIDLSSVISRNQILSKSLVNSINQH